MVGRNRYSLLTEPWIFEYLRRNKKCVGLKD
jgi:hypothetical protein